MYLRTALPTHIPHPPPHLQRRGGPDDDLGRVLVRAQHFEERTHAARRCNGRTPLGRLGPVTQRVAQEADGLVRRGLRGVRGEG